MSFSWHHKLFVTQWLRKNIEDRGCYLSSYQVHHVHLLMYTFLGITCCSTHWSRSWNTDMFFHLRTKRITCSYHDKYQHCINTCEVSRPWEPNQISTEHVQWQNASNSNIKNLKLNSSHFCSAKSWACKSTKEDCTKAASGFMASKQDCRVSHQTGSMFMGTPGEEMFLICEVQFHCTRNATNP